MTDVSQLLNSLAQGETRAAEELLPLVYAELRRLAAAKLAHEPAGLTLQPTALVHEAWLRLVVDHSGCEGGAAHESSADQARWDHRGHFFAAAAEAMRRILIENARRRNSQKRGGGRARVDLELHEPAAPERDEELLALDEALDRLAAADPRKVQLVKLRYFAGLNMAEAAKALGVSLATAERDWSYAKAWLYKEVGGD